MNWLNIPSSPLVFTVPPNRRYLMLVNTSGKDVPQYRLACVAEAGDRLRLLRELPFESANRIPQSGGATNPLPYGDDARQKACGSKEAKYVVWEITFADGSSWKADPDQQ